MIIESGLHCLILTLLNGCSSGVAGTESCFGTMVGS